MKIKNYAMNASCKSFTKYSEAFRSFYRTNFDPVIIMDRSNINCIDEKNMNTLS